MKKKTLALGLWVAMAILSLLPWTAYRTYGGQIKLAWDPSLGSDVAGYTLYYGFKSGNYTFRQNVGGQTSYTLTGIEPGTPCFFSVKAYNTKGEESEPSVELEYVMAIVDTDRDGISDDDERNIYGTNPNNPDTDGDGIKDGAELNLWGENWNFDMDKDGKIALLDWDSDNDGFSDGEEVAKGSDPGDANSKPGGSAFSCVRKVITGLGAHPTHGGKTELFNEHNSHESWMQVNWADYEAFGGPTHLATGDIDGDGRLETIIGLGSPPGSPGMAGGYFEVLNKYHTHLAWGQVPWPDYNRINGETWPSTADIDGDGKEEILIGLGSGGAGKVAVFDYTGGKVIFKGWAGLNWTDYNMANGATRPAAGDLNGDGKKEIILGLGSYSGDPAIPGGAFAILNNDLTHLAWGRVDWADYNAINGETWPAAGDVDGDGKKEILMGLGRGGGGKFEVLRLSGSTVVHRDWNEIDWPDYNRVNGETRIASGDTDLDGKDEILVGSGPGGRRLDNLGRRCLGRICTVGKSPDQLDRLQPDRG